MVKRGQIYGYLRFYQGTDLWLKGTDLWSTRDRFSVDNFFIHRLWITFLDSTRIRYGFSMNLNWISDLDHI